MLFFCRLVLALLLTQAYSNIGLEGLCSLKNLIVLAIVDIFSPSFASAATAQYENWAFVI